jgi:glycosyltransferase involved in cell wall biosynthesis
MIFNKNRNIIFHYPSSLKQSPDSGSSLRPVEMIKGFEKLNYNVFIISGDKRERSAKIVRIKKLVLNGLKISFAYSESLTNPTLLSEYHFLLTNIFLDYQFFYFLKKHQIPLGLFYRDIYWKSELYKKTIPFIKRKFLKIFFWVDIFAYKLLVRELFVPSSQLMFKYLHDMWVNNRWHVLPPGCNLPTLSKGMKVYKRGYKLKLFYVGGVLPPYYDFTKLFNCIQNLNEVTLTIYCRKDEWKSIKNYYSLLSNNIKIVFNGEESLEKYYLEADIFIMFRLRTEYNAVMMPVKIFESIGFGLPIISSSRTAVANLVKQKKLGWVVESENELQKLLIYLNKNPENILTIKNRIINNRNQFTWSVRAQKVVDVLTNEG